MRPCLLGILLISLIGCPSPPVKNGGLTQTGDSTQKKKNLPSQSPKPTPPGPFPSLVTGDTFTHNTPETKTRPIAKIKAQPLVQAANHDQKTPWGSVGEKTGWADPLLRPERRESRCWPN